MSKKINIAIDGPSGAGKSTVAKAVAEKLGYVFINSGSVYRTVALNALNNNIPFDDEKKIEESLEEIEIEIDNEENIYLYGTNVLAEIRSDVISKGASKVAQYPSIREYVVQFIQAITKKCKGYIMDGRDTTFKIMPHAELKIFLTGTPEVRARRRMWENMDRGFETNYDVVLAEVKARDYQDINRKTDPLHIVEDAIVIDTTNMALEEVVDMIVNLAKERSK
ncbi:(d)CMP kinase [Mycoplasma sp. U97]|uniref:Cytidylate kinase n=1 Tax=Mycoplasma tauri TaxID=547987 RepID=A0A953NDY8_9MOLU|nr:(d)CMP kinase [Mycoplasma tauri]MBZ4195203.1 (d)CMP kinase [Mycoplasma tauri]MBZ4212748.1 (d)CMP kinase [Mycoplasma tauri]